MISRFIRPPACAPSSKAGKSDLQGCAVPAKKLFCRHCRRHGVLRPPAAVFCFVAGQPDGYLFSIRGRGAVFLLVSRAQKAPSDALSSSVKRLSRVKGISKAALGQALNFRIREGNTLREVQRLEYPGWLNGVVERLNRTYGEEFWECYDGETNLGEMRRCNS